MENKIFSKFNIYDQIGYILVGSVGLLVTIFNFYILDSLSLVPRFNVQNLIVWLVVAYFLGHTVQAIANIIVKENKTDFTEPEREILSKAKEYFDIEKQSWNEIYLLCYMLSSAKDITGQVDRFNAYYSLYRGWFTVFAMQSALLLALSIFGWFNLGHLILFFSSLILAVLFFRRTKRFYSYSRAKTLQTFLLLGKLGL